MAKHGVYVYEQATLYVPEASISKYNKAKIWKNFTNICGQSGNARRTRAVYDLERGRRKARLLG